MSGSRIDESCLRLTISIIVTSGSEVETLDPSPVADLQFGVYVKEHSFNSFR